MLLSACQHARTCQQGQVGVAFGVVAEVQVDKFFLDQVFCCAGLQEKSGIKCKNVSADSQQGRVNVPAKESQQGNRRAINITAALLGGEEPRSKPRSKPYHDHLGEQTRHVNAERHVMDDLLTSISISAAPPNEQGCRAS